MTTENATQNKDITKVLAEVASAFVGQFDMEGLLARVIETTMDTLDAEVCSIFLQKPDNPNVIECVAGSGFARNLVGEASYEFGEGLTGWVAREGKSITIDSLKQLEAEKQTKGWKGKYDNVQFQKGENEFRNLLVVPLKIKDKVSGVIKAENKKGTEPFSDEDQRVFEIIANVIALAIENVRLQRQSEIQSKKIAETLGTVANAVVGQFERKILLDQILDSTMQILNAEVCSIFLRKEDEPNKIECVAGSGFAKNIVSKAVYEIGEGFTGGVAESQQEFNIRDQNHFKELSSAGGIEWKQKFDNEQWQGGANQFRNLLALPLRIKNEVLGVIKAENKKVEFGQHFSEEDMQIFRTIANVIALAIENLKLYQETQRQLKSISSRAAHRINNQVANYDYIELKLEKLASKLNAQHKEELLGLSNKVFDYTSNLKRMITEFKDFGKPLQLKKEETDINAVIRSEALQHNDKYLSSGTTVSFDLDGNIRPFSFDGGRFAESIKEMLENAKRAFESNKLNGNIFISTRLVKRDNKQNVVVRIQDDGPGISKNTVLFVPFQSTDAQRTGLGLTTVRELMRAHGGDIVHIPTDKGTVFEITLPTA